MCSEPLVSCRFPQWGWTSHSDILVIFELWHSSLCYMIPGPGMSRNEAGKFCGCLLARMPWSAGFLTSSKSMGRGMRWVSDPLLMRNWDIAWQNTWTAGEEKGINGMLGYYTMLTLCGNARMSTLKDIRNPKWNREHINPKFVNNYLSRE